MKRVVPVFLLLTILLYGCKVQPVTLSAVNDVKFGNIDFLRGTVTLDMGLTINNPNNFAVTIHSMELNVTVNGASLGTVFVDEKVKIEKDTEQLYRVNVNAYLTDVINGIPKITGAIAKKQADVALKGKLKVGVGILSKTFPIDFEQKKVATGTK